MSNCHPARPARNQVVKEILTPGQPPVVFGHRGLSSRAPENTMAAFSLLLEHSVAGVELDVHQCASGEIVVAHDDNLQRTAGVPLPLRESSLAQIREHDVGSWFDPAYASERVPLLTEVFELLGRHVIYDIEIKTPGARLGPARQGGVETTLAALIEAHGLGERCIVSSFDPLLLRRFSAVAPEIATALIYTSTPDAPVTVRRARGFVVHRPQLLKPDHAEVTERLILRHHRRGRPVIPWTVDEPAEAIRLATLGVDGIISNCPQELQKALARA